MKKIKKGDIVARKSYGKDIIFYVKGIIETPKGKIAILRGAIDRIEADSEIEDLEIIDRKIIDKIIKEEHKKNIRRLQKREPEYRIGIIESKKSKARQKIVTGKILHLDGDKRYSQKSYNYYKKLGLNAIVKNIPEYKQPKAVYRLLNIYNPDILIVTGHDGMIRRGANFNDIYNYRNSRYFINTVKEARRYDNEKNRKTVIFARSVSKLF